MNTSSLLLLPHDVTVGAEVVAPPRSAQLCHWAAAGRILPEAAARPAIIEACWTSDCSATNGVPKTAPSLVSACVGLTCNHMTNHAPTTTNIATTGSLRTRVIRLISILLN